MHFADSTSYTCAICGACAFYCFRCQSASFSVDPASFQHSVPGVRDCKIREFEPKLVIQTSITWKIGWSLERVRGLNTLLRVLMIPICPRRINGKSHSTNLHQKTYPHGLLKFLLNHVGKFLTSLVLQF